MSFVSLFFIGIVAYIILMPFIEWLCDNHGEIDLIEEQKLTDMYKDRL